jgi:spore maturation protein CgeB
MRLLIAAPTFREWDLGRCLERLLSRRGVEVSRFSWRGLTAEELHTGLITAASRCDTLLGLNMDPVSPTTMSELPCLRVLWHVDCCSPEVPPSLARLLPHLDLVFTTAAGMVERYQALTRAPVHWLVEGAFLEAFRATPQEDHVKFFRGTIAFVGNLLYPGPTENELSTERIELLRRVAERFPIKVFGSQGRPESRLLWRSSPVLDCPVHHRDLLALCRATSIVLGYNRTQVVDRYFSNRTYLTLAAGGFHLTSYVPGLESMFKNHVHLVWFHSTEECLDLLEHYLGRPEERERIAREGQRRVRARYGMGRQAARLLREIARSSRNINEPRAK